MTRMIAPLLAYTSDEIWKYMPHSSNENAEHVIFNEIPENIAIDVDDKFMAFWDRIHELRNNVKKSLESLIKDKTIKGSLEAKVTLCAGGETLEFLKKAEPELCAAFIVSEVEIVDNGGELEINLKKLRVKSASVAGLSARRWVSVQSILQSVSAVFRILNNNCYYNKSV